MEELKRRNEAMATTVHNGKESLTSLSLDSMTFDPEVDQLIDLDKCHSDFVRFNSTYADDELEIQDTINVLIPPEPESSNVLWFELILLESAVIPKDYVVGWGVFPLLNSDFQLNEGKFKCPLLFGNVNLNISMFSEIEKLMIKDLDNWLCNLYFEIEKVNLMDIKADDKQIFFRSQLKKMH